MVLNKLSKKKKRELLAKYNLRALRARNTRKALLSKYNTRAKIAKLKRKK